MTNSFYKISLDIHDHGSHVSLKAKKGDSGANITAPGYYALEVDNGTGDLYCVTEDSATNVPEFTLDENGNLYYEIKED